MFYTIFKHELSYWLRKPVFYIYSSIFFVAALLIASISAGIFDEVSSTVGSLKIVNSPSEINKIFNTLATLIFFLFPSIIGVSVYRDFKSEMYTILYAYPFTKSHYLSAKFLSSLLIVSFIVLFIGLGMTIGFRLPGTNGAIVSAFNPIPYIQAYLVYVLPNVLLFGLIVFAVVVFTRNIVAGFVTVIVLALIQGVTNVMLLDPETRILAAYLDVFGASATDYYTQYWTAAELNESLLPFKGLILYNRLLWLSVAMLISGIVYAYFDFGQQGISFVSKKSGSEPSSNRNLGGVIQVRLPQVVHDYSFLQNVKVLWRLSNVDLKYIVRSWPFIIFTLFGLTMLLEDHVKSGMVRETAMLPVTWKMLRYSEEFQFSMIMCTFLYSGMLLQRARAANILQLTDISPVPNWTLLGSKFLAIIKMQVILLMVIMTAGIGFQLYQGYYHFEIGLYLFGLLGTDLWQFIIWALLAFFIQTLVRNPYLGTFVLLVLLLGLGTPLLRMIGVEQDVFVYGRGPGTPYSDMNGFGNWLAAFYSYILYWLLAGSTLLIGAGLLMDRGFSQSFSERFRMMRARFDRKTQTVFVILLLVFFGMGFRIYYEDNIANPWVSSKEKEQIQAQWELKYGQYKGAIQPRVLSVKTNLDIYPEMQDFKMQGTYSMVNKSSVAIDTIFLKYSDFYSRFELNQTNIAIEDTLYRFNIYQLEKPLQPGDSLELTFTIWNKPNTFLSQHSPILANGTFLNNFKLMPFLGYPGGGLEDNEVRKKYGLPEFNSSPLPSDMTALGNHMISRDSDWIDFETTVSTSEDQIAIAPGYLQKEWIANGRRFFHYKMDSKMLNIYSFNSARYEVKRDQWNGVNLEIYYHTGHDYNLERMMNGMKAALEYCSANFSPYQHRQARVIEFPRTFGDFAQAYPNTIPFSEGRGFIADVDDSEEGGVDYAFDVTVHEMAHQWWAHQVIGADVKGSGVLAEGLADYVRLKVLEKEYGIGKTQKYLKYATDRYLRGRGRDKKGENPLIYEDNQSYLRYSKASVVLYALSDYLGEQNLNQALSRYVKKVQFQEAPYTTSLELVQFLKSAAPDSLQYLISDMFEHITLYDNKIIKAETHELEDGTWQVDIEFLTSKYRCDEKGNQLLSDDMLSYQAEGEQESQVSMNLADYVDVGIFDAEGKEIYLAKRKVQTISNSISIIVDQQPSEVGIDPYHKLIDRESEDNRMEIH
ncbi:MAG: M1 family aminopeptidase [Cytophagales bacterium]|nr:M1 family aminopeptidase [Cytophagales bacterium]